MISKIIKLLIIPVLVLSLLISTCLIAPISVSAEEIENWTFSNPLAVSMSDGDINEGYDIELSGANLARYEEIIDVKKGVSFKLDNVVNRAFISFSNSNQGEPAYNPTGVAKFAAILIPNKEAGTLRVNPYTSTELGSYSTTIENFDFSVPHVYRIVKNTNAYRLYIDDVAITNCFGVTTAQVYQDIYNNGGYVTVGANQGATFEGFKKRKISVSLYIKVLILERIPLILTMVLL